MMGDYGCGIRVRASVTRRVSDSDRQEDYCPRGCRLDRVKAMLAAGKTDQEIMQADTSVTPDYIDLVRRIRSGGLNEIDPESRPYCPKERRWKQPSPQEIEILTARRRGKSYGELARDFGRPTTTIQSIVRRCQAWEDEYGIQLGVETDAGRVEQSGDCSGEDA